MMPDLETVKKALDREKLLHIKRLRLRNLFMMPVLLLCFFIFLFSYVIGIMIVNGDSMYPELQDGDFAVYYRLDQSPDIGDLVVIHDVANKHDYINRVIALGGDVVNITDDGAIKVNSEQLNEPYTHQTKTAVQDITFPQTIPNEQIFALGDNRPVSKDSRTRTIGTIRTKHIKGVLICSYRFN